MVVIVMVALSGCATINELYIKNSSSKETWVTIKFNRPWREVITDRRQLQLLYRDSLLRINRRSRKYMTKKLQYREVNAYKLYMVIPPQSTLLVGGWANKLLDADSIRFNHDGNRFVYSIDSFVKHMESRRSFRSVQYTYHVKD